MKAANLALRFLLELAALAAFGYWGATESGPTWHHAAYGIGAPLLVALFWGTFVGPKARVPLPSGVRFTLGLGVFAFAAAILVERRYVGFAEIFGALVILNASLLLVWRDDEAAPSEIR
jgi:hypothetical protein